MPDIQHSPVPTFLRAAVVGGGHFGKFHVEKYARHPKVDWVGCVDANFDAAKLLTEQWGGSAYADFKALPEDLDCVSIATPAETHAAIARYFLNRGVHVFVEKPLATRLDAGRELVALAKKQKCVLQVNHQERYFLNDWGLPDQLGRVERMEVCRMGPPPTRPSDCSVVLDILIHDLDWIHAFLPGEAFSAKVNEVKLGKSGRIEVIHAELSGSSGLTVTLAGSRESEERKRSARIWTDCGIIDVDFVNRRVWSEPRGLTSRVNEQRMRDCYGDHPYAPEDYVGKSVAHFLSCLTTGKIPLTDGNAGLKALETTLALEAASHSI